MWLPPGGTHIPTWAPRAATVRAEKSTTGIPRASRNVATAASKSSTAMAMRGMAVITAHLLVVRGDSGAARPSGCHHGGAELGQAVGVGLAEREVGHGPVVVAAVAGPDQRRQLLQRAPQREVVK